MTDTPKQHKDPITLDLNAHERLLEQISRSAINVCASPNCERLTPATICSICVSQTRKQPSQPSQTTQRTCAIDGCTKPTSNFNSKTCSKEHRKMRENLIVSQRRAAGRAALKEKLTGVAPAPLPLGMTPETCSIEGCTNPARKNALTCSPLHARRRETDRQNARRAEERAKQTQPAQERVSRSRYRPDVASAGDPCHMPGCPGKMELQKRRDGGGYFFGCSRYFSMNRKDGEKACRAIAPALVQFAGQPAPPVTIISRDDIPDDIPDVIPTPTVTPIAETPVVHEANISTDSAPTTLPEALKHIAVLRHSVRQLERMMENNTKTLNEVRRTMDNIDARSDEALKGVNKLVKQLG